MNDDINVHQFYARTKIVINIITQNISLMYFRFEKKQSF